MQTKYQRPSLRVIDLESQSLMNTSARFYWLSLTARPERRSIRITPAKLESFRLECRRGLSSSRDIQLYFPDCYSFRKERVAVAFFDDALLSENAQNICFSGLISHIATLCLFQTSAHLFFSSSIYSFPALFRSFCALFPLVSLLIVSASFPYSVS